MKLFKPVISFLLYSNLFIALCACALVFQTSLLLKEPLSFQLYIFIFCATLLEYNIQRFMVLIKDLPVPVEPRYNWLFNNRILFYVLFFLTVVGLIVSGLQLPSSTYPWIIAATLFTTLYTFPLIPTPNGLKRLRAIPHMKVVSIGLVWTLSTIFLPYSTVETDVRHILLAALIRLLFIIAITIPFDVRDIISDQARGLKTIPLVFGIANSYHIAVGILIVVCMLGWLSHTLNDHFYGMSMTVVSLLTMAFIKKEGWKSHPYYYYGLLDGTMILGPAIHLFLYKYFI